MLKKKYYNNIFQIWLITLIFLISLIIVVGGLTRLTDSGLSITEWELFKGILPPTSINSWMKYFESYKQIPQFKFLNSQMTLEEFKFIFLWEYAHRLLARFIGLFFLIPFIFFLFIDLLKKKTIVHLIKIFLLILIQGSIGWYMVTSGLLENISVSHYRLSIHLFLAFCILSSVFWILLNHLNKEEKKFFKFNKYYSPFSLLVGLIFFQITLGAFVSGLDAGKIYQTWPLMNENYFPNDVLVFDYLNFDQPSVVQFFHRNVAYIIFTLSIYLGFNIYKKKKTRLYKSFLIYFSIVLVQVILGISTLVSGVNIYMASMHQISSIFLVLAVLTLYHRLIST